MVNNIFYITTILLTIFSRLHLSQDTAVCGDYFSSGELITGQICSGCDLCGDGLLCQACPDLYALNNPQGMCGEYVNAENVTISDETCTGCNYCGDGYICGVCTDYYLVVGESHPPTVEPTLAPTTPTSIPTFEPTPLPVGVCPNYYSNFVLITEKPCSQCELCGDGSTCSACNNPNVVSNPQGVCPDFEGVGGVTCHGCSTCPDGTVCGICPEYQNGGLTYAPSATPSAAPILISANSSSAAAPVGTGAIAGIAVGAFVIIVIAFFCYGRKSHVETEKKRPKAHKQKSSQTPAASLRNTPNPNYSPEEGELDTGRSSDNLTSMVPSSTRKHAVY
jgi:hypothetical protein